MTGGFARHHTFRYIALNTLMRQQAYGHSRFYVNKQPQTVLTRAELQRALEDPDRPEAQAVLTRYPGLPALSKARGHFGIAAAGSAKHSRTASVSPAVLSRSVRPTYTGIASISTCPSSSVGRLPRSLPEWRSPGAYCARTRISQRGTSTRVLRLSARWFSPRSSTFPTISTGTNGKDGVAAITTGSTGLKRARYRIWRRRRVGRSSPGLWGYHISATNPRPGRIGQGDDGGNPLRVDPAGDGHHMGVARPDRQPLPAAPLLLDILLAHQQPARQPKQRRKASQSRHRHVDSTSRANTAR